MPLYSVVSIDSSLVLDPSKTEQNSLKKIDLNSSAFQKYVETPRDWVPVSELELHGLAAPRKQQAGLIEIALHDHTIYVTHASIKPGAAGGVAAVLQSTPARKGDIFIYADYDGSTPSVPKNYTTQCLSESLSQPTSSSAPVDAPRFGVQLSPEQKSLYYFEASNGCLWPVDHSMIGPDTLKLPSSAAWQKFWESNEAFAHDVAKAATPSSFIFVHDYQLQGVPQLVRDETRQAKGFDPHIAYFHHVPVPKPEVLHAVRAQEGGEETYHNICRAFRGRLGADLVGFHSPEYVNNYLDICEKELGLTVERFHVNDEVAWGRVIVPDSYDGHAFRVSTVGTFPISVNAQAFLELARDPKSCDAASKLLEDHFEIDIKNEYVLFNANRADFTKAFLERIDAYDLLLDQHPELIGKVRFVEFIQSTRDQLDSYADYAQEIKEAIFRVNNKYQSGSWYPIAATMADHGKLIIPTSSAYDGDISKLELPGAPAAVVAASYGGINGEITRQGLLAPSLRDGMHLGAAEYVAAGAMKGLMLLGDGIGAQRFFQNTGVEHVDVSLPGSPQQMADIMYGHLTSKWDSGAVRKVWDIIAQYTAEDWVGTMIDSHRVAALNRWGGFDEDITMTKFLFPDFDPSSGERVHLKEPNHPLGAPVR